MIPENIRRPEAITDLDHAAAGRAARPAEPAVRPRPDRRRHLGSHNEAYQRVRGLMASETLFDISQEPQTVRDAYGPTQFGEQALVARRLVEAGVPFVRVGRAWWDSHGQNFETHQELVPELDHVMATLLDDLAAARAAREHAGHHARRVRPHARRSTPAWAATTSPPPGAPRSRAAAIKGGSVYGKTDAKGQTVVDGEVGAAELFATIYQALGIDHQKNYHGRLAPRPADRARHRADRGRAGLSVGLVRLS